MEGKGFFSSVSTEVSYVLKLSEEVLCAQKASTDFSGFIRMRINSLYYQVTFVNN